MVQMGLGQYQYVPMGNTKVATILEKTILRKFSSLFFHATMMCSYQFVSEPHFGCYPSLIQSWFLHLCPHPIAQVFSLVFGCILLHIGVPSPQFFLESVFVPKFTIEIYLSTQFFLRACLCTLVFHHLSNSQSYSTLLFTSSI